MNQKKPGRKTGRSRTVLNVRNLMYQYAKHKDTRISPEAVKAMAGRLEIFVARAMPQIERIARADKRVTIKEHEDLKDPSKSKADVTRFFSFKENQVEELVGGKKL